MSSTTKNSFHTKIIQSNELRVIVDIPHQINIESEVVLTKTNTDNGVRYELVFPTMAYSSSNEEWSCTHSTSVVDIRSGVSGSLSKKAKTEQRRSVVTDYHIKAGSPDYKIKHSIVQCHTPDIPAHLQHNGEEEEASDSDSSENPISPPRVMTLVNPKNTSRAMELIAKFSKNGKNIVDK